MDKFTMGKCNSCGAWAGLKNGRCFKCGQEKDEVPNDFSKIFGNDFNFDDFSKPK